MQPPPDYASYKQLLGRSERACNSTDTALESFMVVSTRCAEGLQKWVTGRQQMLCNHQEPTQDERFLKDIVFQRSQIEPVLKMMFDDVQLGLEVLQPFGLVKKHLITKDLSSGQTTISWKLLSGRAPTKIPFRMSSKYTARPFYGTSFWAAQQSKE